MCGIVAPTMIGGTGGADSLTAGSGNNLVVGAAGNDIITTSGSGNDSLYGGDGNDTIIFSGYASTTIEGGNGDGTICDFGDSNFSPVGEDTLLFGDEIHSDNVVVSRVGNNLVAVIRDAANPLATDQVTVQNWYWGAVYRIERFLFADGTCLTSGELTVMGNTIIGSDADNVLSGFLGDSLIRGLGGNDTITDGGGNDTIDGGAGDDVITDEELGNNVLIGGDGNDRITYCNYASNIIDGGAGNDTILVNSFRFGDANYANAISGGTGNDRITASGAADTYRFNRSDGSDTVYDFGYSGYSPAGLDTLVFGQNVAADQLWFRHVGNGLKVDVIGTSDNVTIENWYYGSDYHIESFKLADGRTLADTQVELLVQAMASFAPPAAGQTVLPQNCQAALTPVIAANWH